MLRDRIVVRSEVADASLAMMCSALPAEELSYLLTMLARTVRRRPDAMRRVRRDGRAVRHLLVVRRRRPL